MDAHSRRQAALDAIAKVAAGARAADIESEVVDFKQETGTVVRGGRRAQIDPHHERAAQTLAGEAACMAMGEQGGVLVVGVNDKESGAAAFVGSHLDLSWLRQRIYALTQPHLSLDIFEEAFQGSVRLYLINVPPALEEIRSGGRLRARVGTDCVELDGDRARRFLERRRRYDWSAEPSGMRLSEADRGALKSAHQHYTHTKGTRAGSDRALVQRMNVTLDDGADPELNRAGALLLCAYDPQVEQLDVRYLDTEGAASRRRELLRAPLMLGFDRAWDLIDETFPAEVVVVGAQRTTVRPIPERALREALVNAIMHRDYRMPRASIVALAIGRPAQTFKVISVGAPRRHRAPQPHTTARRAARRGCSMQRR